jgi:integrase
MANKYKKTGSPYWWIRMKDPVTGRYKDKSSKLRWNNAQETKQCDARLALTNTEESKPLNKGERWEEWVETFFVTCVPHEVTRQGYRQDWAWVRSFLIEKGISTPREITYQLGIEFLAWRRTHGVKKITMATTAFRGLKVLRRLMNHAVRCGYAPGNPLNHMGLPRPQHERKPEFTDDHLKQLYAAFAKHCTETDWRYVAFRIASEIGVRLSETQIEWRDVDFENSTIFIRRPKRSNGRDKSYTTILPTSLRPLLERLKDRGGNYVMVLPDNASQLFGNFIRREAKLPGFCFHCTRVTFNARLERNRDISGRVAMQALNHTSPSVHAVYSRPSVEDLRQIDGKVVYPPEPVFPVKESQNESSADTKRQSLPV